MFIVYRIYCYKWGKIYDSCIEKKTPNRDKTRFKEYLDYIFIMIEFYRGVWMRFSVGSNFCFILFYIL